MSNIREKSMDLPLISRFYKSSLATATRSKGGGIPRPWPPPPQSVTPPTVTNLSTDSSRPVSQGGVGMCGKARLDYSNCGWFIVSSFAIFRTWRFKFQQEIFAVVCACNCACVCVWERACVCVSVSVSVCLCVCVYGTHTHTHTNTHMTLVRSAYVAWTH